MLLAGLRRRLAEVPEEEFAAAAVLTLAVILHYAEPVEVLLLPFTRRPAPTLATGHLDDPRKL